MRYNECLHQRINDRISIDPKICHGKPCIKGTRIMVDNILGLLAGGYDFARIREGYPHITDDDIIATIDYARSVVNDEEIILLSS